MPVDGNWRYGCHGSNLAYLVRETTTRLYLVSLRTCSSDPAMIIYLSTQGKREHSSRTVHPRYSMGQCTALHHVDT
ncbi:hypothetical protein CFP56_038366 [Quercus suber]|uniref:Uncharacterized protein n=1 Tax=Quercus suber TaxID=58331 RepID=A0AAW0J2R2_QUESU